MKVESAALLPIILGIVVASCSDVRLQAPKGGVVDTATGDFSSALKPPEDIQTNLRVLFFVDQSYSMIHGKCQSDLDGSNPKGSSTGCENPEPGIDPEGHRFAVLKKWMQELTQSLPKAKVAVFPFSGGMNERPRKYPYNNTAIHDGPELYKFLTIPEALGRIADLEAEQRNDLQKDTRIDNGNFVGSAPTYMGTTVPLPTLIYARDRLMEEMEALQKQGQLHSTRFRFIYLSDGVFRPTDDLIDRALGLAGKECSRKCLQDPRVMTCEAGWISIKGHGWNSLSPEEKKQWPVECGNPGAYGYVGNCFCINMGNDLYQAFGEPADNQASRIIDTLEQIKNLPKYFGEGALRIDFVRLHPERIQIEDQQDIFDQMQGRAGDSPESIVTSTQPPFSIVSPSPAQLSYQLDSFYVINLNAFVSEDGRLVADSDGDGLSDEEELASKSDPLDPRTPDSDGKRWCLDSIEQSFGCKKTSCSADLDSDNDGLNECEEFSLQTDAFHKENSSDAILDSLKAMRRFSTASDSRVQDSNGDGLKDFEAFRRGYRPLAPTQDLDPSVSTQVRVEFKGYVRSRDRQGNPVQTAQYLIDIENLPLVATLETKRGSELYYSRVKSPSSRIDNEHLIGAAPHAQMANEILLLGKVRALQDPNKSYFIFARKTIFSTGRPTHLKVDFSDFQQLPGK